MGCTAFEPISIGMHFVQKNTVYFFKISFM